MNEFKQFLVDSIAQDYSQAFDSLSSEEKQQVTMKLAEIYTILDEPQKAQRMIAAIPTAEARQIEAQALFAQQKKDAAITRYLEAFQMEPTAEAYLQLAALYEKAGQREDSAYYTMMAHKLNAYKSLAALQDMGVQEAVFEQAHQMIEHPTSFDGWLESVKRLNDEELAQSAENAPLIEEPKRTIVKPKIVVAAATEPVIAQKEERPLVETPVLAPEQAIQPPVMPPQQQASPYVDPHAFIAAQQAQLEETKETTDNDDLNDFESMYFGEMYED